MTSEAPRLEAAGSPTLSAAGTPAEDDVRQRALTFLRKQGVHVGLDMLVNLALPFLVYSLCEKPFGQVIALMAASCPPILWAVIEFIRTRRVDALSILVLAGVCLSLLAYAGGGSVMVLQLREKLVTALIGLVFLGSAAIGRPVMYELGRATVKRRNPSELAGFEALKSSLNFRRTLMTMTLVWGCGLVAEAVVAAALVSLLSVREYLLVGHLMGYGVAGALGLWSFFYVRRRRQLRPGCAQKVTSAGQQADGVNGLVAP